MEYRDLFDSSYNEPEEIKEKAKKAELIKSELVPGESTPKESTSMQGAFSKPDADLIYRKSRHSMSLYESSATRSNVFQICRTDLTDIGEGKHIMTTKEQREKGVIMRKLSEALTTRSITFLKRFCY